MITRHRRRWAPRERVLDWRRRPSLPATRRRLRGWTCCCLPSCSAALRPSAPDPDHRNPSTEHVQFVSTLSKGRNFVRHCCRNRQHCCQKRQQCRSNIRHCRKSRSTCSIRHWCFDIVADVDGASTKLPVASTMLLQHCCWYGRDFRRLSVCRSQSHSTYSDVVTNMHGNNEIDPFNTCRVEAFEIMTWKRTEGIKWSELDACQSPA